MKVKLSGVRSINISGEFIKLDALLKYSSIASTGGEAKMFIQSGDVFVNGELCLKRGKKIKNGDIVRFNNDTIKVYAN